MAMPITVLASLLRLQDVEDHKPRVCHSELGPFTFGFKLILDSSLRYLGCRMYWSGRDLSYLPFLVRYLASLSSLLASPLLR